MRATLALLACCACSAALRPLPPGREPVRVRVPEGDYAHAARSAILWWNAELGGRWIVEGEWGIPMQVGGEECDSHARGYYEPGEAIVVCAASDVIDVQWVWAHELGHAVGLGHSSCSPPAPRRADGSCWPASESVMCPTLDMSLMSTQDCPPIPMVLDSDKRRVWGR